MEKMLSSSMRFVIFLTICDKVCVICSRFDKLSMLSFLSEKGAISLNSAILTRGDSITFTSDEQCSLEFQKNYSSKRKVLRATKNNNIKNVITSQSTTKNKKFQIFYHHFLISIGTPFFVEILLTFHPHTNRKIQ